MTARKKSGGRVAGTKNIRTQEIEEDCEKEGMTPLQFFIKTMRDETKEMNQRLDAAKSAAPYIHRKQPIDIITEGTLTFPQIEITYVASTEKAPDNE